DIINWLISFSKSFLFFIIKYIIAIFGLGTIASIIIKIVRRNNVDVIFGGELSSGKTTIFKRLENPEITESELLSITSTKSTKKQRGTRIAVGKRDIYPLMLDNPGQQYADIFDGINKRFLCNPHRILIYAIALFPENKSDEDIHKNDQYRIGQIHKAIQLLSIVLKSKTVKSLDKIVVFVNKMDLLYENEVAFSKVNRNNEGINLLKKINGFEELNEIIAYSPKVEIIYGSALKGWGIYKIRDIIKGVI
ncbi:MAG: hypothetical protein K2J60_11010, partial [Acetatifactor sp.]|nr:hypothetical protein [Acetatifactor sp.]